MPSWGLRPGAEALLVRLQSVRKPRNTCTVQWEWDGFEEWRLSKQQLRGHICSASRLQRVLLAVHQLQWPSSAHPGPTFAVS